MLDKKEFNRQLDHQLFLSAIKKHFRLLPLWAIISLLTFALSQPVPAKAAGVTLSATPPSRTINQGQAATYTISINRDNYAGSVRLSASNLPSGATALLNPNPTTVKNSSLTVTTNAATPTGTFQIKVAGSASGISINPINVTLIVRPAPGVTLTAMPTAQSIIAGQPIDYKIKLTRTNYDAPVTLAATLPDGLTARFEPNPVYGNDSTMRIYSHLLPFVTKDYHIDVSIRELLLPGVRINARFNCDVNWAEQFGTTGGGDFAEDVAIASDGSIYVAGNNFNPNNNSRDAWVAKFNVNGFLIWLERLETAGDDFATEIAADNSGNVFVGGYTNGTMPDNTPVNGFDLWIAKYDSLSGNRLWVRQAGSQTEDGAGGFEIVPDNQGDGELTTFWDDQSVIVTFSFDANGSLIEQANRRHTLDTQFRDNPNDIALGPNGEVYVVGLFTNSVPQHTDGYLIKFEREGINRAWLKTIQNLSSPSDEEAMRAVVDAAGNYVYVAAKTDRSGNTDAWLLQFESDGDDGWFREEISPADDLINALVINNDGDLIVAGKTSGVLGERNGGDFDAWVARRAAGSGNLKWVRQFPVIDKDGFNAVAIAGNNDLILAGETVNFKRNLGFEDALVMRYADAWSLFSPVINNPNGLVPSSGQVSARISINGLHLTGITGVRFNGIPAEFTPRSSTLIEAIVPEGVTDGRVTVSSGCNSASSAADFDVLP